MKVELKNPEWHYLEKSDEWLFRAGDHYVALLGKFKDWSPYQNMWCVGLNSPQRRVFNADKSFRSLERAKEYVEKTWLNWIKCHIQITGA